MANKRIFSSFDTSATAIPLYDSWGSADYWQCNEWVNWHKSLVDAYGKNKANEIWINAWMDGLSNVAGGKGSAPGANYITDSVPLDCRSFNQGFRDYLKKYPELYNAVFSGLTGTIVQPIGGTVDIASNIGSSAATISKIVKYGLPTAIILFTGIIAYRLYKK